MKGYFAVDLIIDKDDRMHIIDIHGYSDVVSFSERAGYRPRKSRVHRFMEIAKRTAGDKAVVHLINANLYGERQDYNYPSELLDFFKKLPKDSYNIDWIQAKFEREKKLTSQLMEDELLFLDEAARKHDVKYYPGSLHLYDDYLTMTKIDLRKDQQSVVNIPYDDIGLVIPWGKNYAMHPHAPNYWRGDFIELPTLSTKVMHYIFNTESKKMRNDVFRKITNALPEEVYIGMAASNVDEITELVSKHDRFVHKPVCAHTGIGIQYLTQEEAFKFVEKEKKIEPYHNEILEKIKEANKNGFAIEKDKFQGYFFTNSGRSRIRVDDLGVYTLQERLIARPFKSFKTGKEHTGTIRAQIYAGEAIGIMHRLSQEEYTGKDQVITDASHKTFWERVDDDLEGRIVDFLVPIFTDVEDYVNGL